MTSKQIATKYLAPKISDPAMIFKDQKTFQLVFEWAKDSAREFFETQPSKMSSVSYVDDAAPFVDKYLISRALKIYEKAMETQNGLSEKLSSSETTVAWVIDRWINTFINLTSDPKYKDYINISKIKVPYIEEECFEFSDIEDVIEFEKLQKLPREQIKEALKLVWEDSYLDSSFNIDDMKELCQKFQLSLFDVFGYEPSEVPILGKKLDQYGNDQLFLQFDEGSM